LWPLYWDAGVSVEGAQSRQSSAQLRASEFEAA
jgi:hypothetical protein